MTPSPAARLLGLTFKRAIGPVLVIVEDHRGVADNLRLLVIRNHTAPYLHLLVAEAVHGKNADVDVLIRGLKVAAGNRSQGCKVRCASNHLIVSVYRVLQMQDVGRADVLLYFKCPTTKQMRCPVNAYSSCIDPRRRYPRPDRRSRVKGWSTSIDLSTIAWRCSIV